jgi:hypothetical protein
VPVILDHFTESEQDEEDGPVPAQQIPDILADVEIPQ